MHFHFWSWGAEAPFVVTVGFFYVGCIREGDAVRSCWYGPITRYGKVLAIKEEGDPVVELDSGEVESVDAYYLRRIRSHRRLYHIQNHRNKI